MGLKLKLDMENNKVKEKWSIWMPDIIPVGDYELTELCQNRNGLKLIFDNELIRVKVTYEAEILAFRSCDEGDRWRTIDSVLGINGGDFFKGRLLFKVDNSEFKNWFIQENFAMREECEFEHHAFITANDVIDVLALHEPQINVVFKDYH